MKRPQLSYTPKGLQLTDDDFHALHQKAAGRAARVSISAEALRHLLHDHSALYVRLEEVDRHLRHREPLDELAGRLEAAESDIRKDQERQQRARGRRRVDPLLIDDDEDLIG